MWKHGSVLHCSKEPLLQRIKVLKPKGGSNPGLVVIKRFITPQKQENTSTSGSSLKTCLKLQTEKLDFFQKLIGHNIKPKLHLSVQGSNRFGFLLKNKNMLFYICFYYFSIKILFQVKHLCDKQWGEGFQWLTYDLVVNTFEGTQHNFCKKPSVSFKVTNDEQSACSIDAALDYKTPR